MRTLVLFFSLMTALAFVSKQAYCQNAGKLTGTVADSTKPLPLVTVRLFRKNSDTPLQTVVAKDNGSFQLNTPDTGAYVISFTHSGFTEKRVTVNVISHSKDIQVDPVQLIKSSGTMNEVVVKTTRPLVEQSDDKIVFNAEDDPATKTETAIDILRRTPFVTVDGNDNLQVNGKSNFKILLNGKETSMFANNVKQALQSFPGALISKIEVITTPSAKYDGEGIGGLINIITRKRVVGYNGTLSAFTRTSDKVSNFSVNGNAKVGKVGFSIFMNKGFQDPVSQYSINTTLPALHNIYSRRTLEGNQRPSGNWSFGNAELSWDVDSLNTVSVYTNINSFSNTTLSDQTITTDFMSAPSSVSYYHLNNVLDNPGVNIGSDYIRHFASNKDREFSLRFLAELGKSNSELNSFQDNSSTDRYLINNSNAINDQYTIQADNSIPLSKTTKFDGGVKAILRRASSDFRSLLKYDPSSDYEINPANTDYFKYTQNVYSAYGMYTVRFKKSNLRAGVRIENTDVNGNFVSTKTEVNHNYTTILPNILYTDNVSKITTLSFGYTKRLQRPYIYDLNPFVNNNDSLNISFGNPNLGPQTVHVLTTSVRVSKGGTFAGINLEGTYSNNKILQYSSFDPQTGITKTTSLNIGKEFQSSLNINLSTKLTTKLSLFANGSIRFSTVTNNSNKAQSNSGFGSNVFMNATYRFSDKFSISNFLGFWKDPQTIQTTYPLTTWYNVAFNYKAFKNKVNISLRAVNFFEKTHDFETITKDQNFYNTNINRQIKRALAVALTWNFGKLKENVSKKKGVTNDDLLTKPQTPATN